MKTPKTLTGFKKLFSIEERAFICAALPYLTTESISLLIKKEPELVDAFVTILKNGNPSNIPSMLKHLFDNNALNCFLKEDNYVLKRSKSKYKNNSGVREDLQRLFRSNMEANFARILNLYSPEGQESPSDFPFLREYCAVRNIPTPHKLTWSYEEDTFSFMFSRKNVKKSISFIPDFKIRLWNLQGECYDTLYIEVKGRLFPNDRTKIQCFRKTNRPLILIAKDVNKSIKQLCDKVGASLWLYDELVILYKSSIPTWE
jgi:hypothetical protein